MYREEKWYVSTSFDPRPRSPWEKKITRTQIPFENNVELKFPRYLFISLKIIIINEVVTQLCPNCGDALENEPDLPTDTAIPDQTTTGRNYSVPLLKFPSRSRIIKSITRDGLVSNGVRDGGLINLEHPKTTPG